MLDPLHREFFHFVRREHGLRATPSDAWPACSNGSPKPGRPNANRWTRTCARSMSAGWPASLGHAPTLV